MTLAAKFVESEVKTWLQTVEGQYFKDVLPMLAGKIIELYEEYRKQVGAKDCSCKERVMPPIEADKVSLCSPSIAQDLVPLSPKFKAMDKQVEYNVGYSCPDLDQDLSDFDMKVHDSSPTCWCQPTQDEDGVWIHKYVRPS